MLNLICRAGALTALACAAFAVSASSAPAATSPVPIQLRVETSGETLYNGPLTTSPRLGVNGINLAPTPIDPNSCTHAFDPVTFGYAKKDIPVVTPTTAAADFADAEGLDHIVKDFGWGNMVCGIGSFLGDNNQFWLVKIGNRSQTPGGGFITGDTELKPGDELLWYFTSPSITHTLDLDLPAQVFVGEVLTGSVFKYSNTNDSMTPARGASVAGGGAAGVADVNGRARLRFPEPGSYLVSAAANGATRGSDVIEVLEKPGPTAQSKARRVCAKYRRGWRKYNKRYKRIYKRCFRSATLRFASGR